MMTIIFPVMTFIFAVVAIIGLSAIHTGVTTGIWQWKPLLAFGLMLLLLYRANRSRLRAYSEGGDDA